MIARRLLLVALFASAGAGCSKSSAPSAPLPPASPIPTPPGMNFLSPTEHLVRASMALRGIRPSIAELQQVQADPTTLPGIVDAYLEAPQFADTIGDMHNDVLQVRTEATQYVLPIVGVASNNGWTASQVNHAVMEEPLKLIEYVVTNNRPYTEIVTADYTVADGISAAIWPGLSYPGTGAGDWEVSHWTDGKPAAGILDSNALLYRHFSAGSNYHRGRANWVSKSLLCDDFLQREVIIDTSVDLSDPNAVANAVANNPSCASCHQTLDPLASYFMGYQGTINAGNITSYPITGFYKVSRENQWQTTNKRAPGYYGQPGGRLDDLGAKIAADDRFSLCTAERFYSYLTQTGLGSVDVATAASLQSTLVDSGWDAKALTKAIVLSPGFRAATATSSGDPDAVVGMLKARPEQLSRMFKDLTGFTWETELPLLKVRGAPWGRVELPTTDFVGYRVLGGGIDSYYVTIPTYTVNTTSSLFLRAFAAEASGYVVTNDAAIAAPASRTLFTTIPDLTDTSESDVRLQLADLHLRLYGLTVDPNSSDVDDAWTLWSDTWTRTGDPLHAWKTTLTGMLQDVRIAYY